MTIVMLITKTVHTIIVEVLESLFGIGDLISLSIRQQLLILQLLDLIVSDPTMTHYSYHYYSVDPR